MSGAEPTAAPAREERALGLTMCIALLVGNTIGMGIFLTPASLAPYGMNALPAWLITAFGSVCIAWVFAGLARTFPADDGPMAYASRAFGGGAAFVIMWCYWVSCIATLPVLVTGAVGYLSTFFPVLGVNHGVAAVTALALLWLFVLVNVRGLRTAGGVQVLTTVLKLLPLVGIIALGAWAFLAPHAQPLIHVPQTPASFSGLFAASTLALYSMLGVECAAMPAGRVRDPARTIPRATFIGTLLVAFICMCVSLIPMLLLPQAQLAHSDAPFSDLFARFLGPQSARLIAVFVIVSALGCLNGWILILGELTVSLARHGGFPRALGRLSARGAPTLALVLTGLLASLMVPASYSDSLLEAFNFLIEVVTAANLPVYIGCALAVLLLWRRGTITLRDAPTARWIAAAGFASLYCVWVCFGFGARPLLWALALCGVGVFVYVVYWWSTRTQRAALAASAAPLGG
jgi:basic amino acid/polyamine antiporter, APA family